MALSGQQEYINFILFEAVDYDRTMAGEGKPIMCYDSKADMSSPPLWNYQNTSFENETVPAEHKVRVIGATVRFTFASCHVI